MLEYVPSQPLRNEIQRVYQQGGVNAELYVAVGNWRDWIISQGGRPLPGTFSTRTDDDLIVSLMPLLLGVDDAQEKARRYFIDQDRAEIIGDPKFGQRAGLWERMCTPYDADGLKRPDGVVETDVPALVMRVLAELNPEVVRLSALPSSL